MQESMNRRDFLKGASAAGIGYWVANQYARGEEGTSPTDKLNIGIVGVTGRGGDNIKEMNEECGKLINIAALCDVDDNDLAKACKQFPKARTYNDYRKMLEQKDLDAVLVATPDHAHAWITLAALRSGRHVYCEKPLAHSVEEIRVVTETAMRAKRVTQMGTQIHSLNNYRRVVELIQSGAIGAVSEAHVFIDKTWYQDKPAKEGVPVPANLHWDLWQCATAERAYSPDYLPFVWRRWWAFGEGTLGDMGCHFIDLPKWALQLGAPTKIRAEGPEVHPEWCPKWLTVHYEFPARGDLPPVRLTWSDAGKKPDAVKDLNLPKWKNGVLFVGEKGKLLADYGRYKLLPEDTFKDFEAPKPTIAASPGHHKEWVIACMKNEPMTPLCNFSYSGPLSEAVLLGTVAYRTGEELTWDSEKLTATNTAKAEEFIKLKYREGWVL